MSVDDALVCPRCGDDSSIAKVSGVHRGRNSKLTQLLSPASETGSFHPVPEEMGVLGGVILGAVIGHVAGGVGGVFVGSIGGMLIGLIASHVINAVAASQARQERRPEYLRMLEQWERAYYCQKHDLVFLPGGDWTGSPTDFHNLMS